MKNNFIPIKHNNFDAFVPNVIVQQYILNAQRQSNHIIMITIDQLYPNIIVNEPVYTINANIVVIQIGIFTNTDIQLNFNTLNILNDQLSIIFNKTVNIIFIHLKDMYKDANILAK